MDADRAAVYAAELAAFDGTDAVMLSAETATGKDPAKVIEAMDRLADNGIESLVMENP